MSGRWDRWEIEHKVEANEWEMLAIEKCDLSGEEFLAHYFEPRVCLECFKTEMFSILRTKQKMRGGEYDIKYRRWCTGCGHFHRIERQQIGGRVYFKRTHIGG